MRRAVFQRSLRDSEMAVESARIRNRLQRDFDKGKPAVFLSAQSFDISRFTGGDCNGLEIRKKITQMARTVGFNRLYDFIGFDYLSRATHQRNFERCGKFACRRNYRPRRRLEVWQSNSLAC